MIVFTFITRERADALVRPLVHAELSVREARAIAKAKLVAGITSGHIDAKDIEPFAEAVARRRSVEQAVRATLLELGYSESQCDVLVQYAHAVAWDDDPQIAFESDPS